MTRFCGWLIILDTHTHTDTHFHTQNTCMGHRHKYRWTLCIHIFVCARTLTHAHIITPHPVCLASLTSTQIRLYSAKLIVCYICCKQHPFSLSGTIHSPHTVTVCVVVHTFGVYQAKITIFFCHFCNIVKTHLKYHPHKCPAGDEAATGRCHPGCPDALPTCTRPRHRGINRDLDLSLHTAALQSDYVF